MQTVRTATTWIFVALAALLAAACGDGGIETEAEAQIEVSSPDLEAGATIPTQFTCDGEEVAPTVAWSGLPEGTEEIVLVVDDPDAPSGIFTHWIVWGLGPDDSPLSQPLPEGAVQGVNNTGGVGYAGPCPPEGDEPHQYRFRVLALDTTLGLDQAASPGDLESAIDGHVIGEGQLTANYGR